MKTKTVIWAVIGVAAALFVSQGAPRPTSFDANSYLATPQQRFEEVLRQQDLQQAREATLAHGNDFKIALERGVERHCETTIRRPFLEPQGSLEPLLRAGYSTSIPVELKVPPTFTTLGLAVRVRLADPDGARLCIDVSQAMVDQLSQQAPVFPANALKKIAPGAWLLTTTYRADVPASSALVSAPFLRALGPKSLVAFAPVDEVVAFADAANPSAIRAAAKRLVETVVPATTESFTEPSPLIFKDGMWSRWAPMQPAREVRDAQKLGEALETKMTLRLLRDDIEFTDSLAQDPMLSASVAKRESLPRGLVTDLVIESDLRTSVFFEPLEPTLVGQADSVIMGTGTTPMPWDVFLGDHSAEITPVFVDGVLIPRVVKWTPF